VKTDQRPAPHLALRTVNAGRAGRPVGAPGESHGRPRMGVRASADGEKLYIYLAGSTIDVYDRDTLRSSGS